MSGTGGGGSEAGGSQPAEPCLQLPRHRPPATQRSPPQAGQGVHQQPTVAAPAGGRKSIC